MVERDFDLPEFEQRADVFINELNTLKENNKDFRWCYVRYLVEKTFPSLISGLDKLQSLIDDSEVVPVIRPGDLADVYDVESANSCIVEFNAITDDKRPLETFVGEVLQLAEEHKSEIDSSMLFGTEDEVDFIEPRLDEANGLLFHTRIYFRFR